MTPEMVFECLIVSDDIQVLSLMTCALGRLSIDVERCADPAKGLELLAKHDVDLVVCDCKGAAGEIELLHGVLISDRKRKPTVITVIDGPFLALAAKSAGAHVVIRKPLTRESCTQGLKAAYSRMVREERRARRYAIMRRVLAKNRRGELVQVTVTDVTEHGVGLLSRQQLTAGDVLSFDLVLPNAERSVAVEVRVLWWRHNLAGAGFKGISRLDRQFVSGWCESRAKPDRKSEEGSQVGSEVLSR